MNTDMTPIEIKIEFMKHAVSQAGIARQCNVTQGHVHRVISGKSTSNRVQRAIAKAINKPVDQVFADRYSATKRDSILSDRRGDRMAS
ncbi:MAG: helix-turn-helix domain-containing protein [Desulfuromusa sp.]|nr:helix-turn-helix domain-containing protein [Desulfuromusa sp.]